MLEGLTVVGVGGSIHAQFAKAGVVIVDSGVFFEHYLGEHAGEHFDVVEEGFVARVEGTFGEGCGGGGDFVFAGVDVVGASATAKDCEEIVGDGEISHLDEGRFEGSGLEVWRTGRCRLQRSSGEEK